MLHPVGPRSRGTYWRRRLVALLVLVAVVVLAVVGIRSLTTGDDAAAQQPTTIDPSTVAAPTESPTESPTPTDTPTESATETTLGPCEASALTVTLTTKATTYGPGQTPRFVLTVANESESPCQAEIGSAMRVFTVSDSAGTQVWSSADCQGETGSQVYTIDPDASRSMTYTWSRLRSAAGCPDGQSAVEAGNYTVNGTWDDISAEPVSVSLAG